MPRSRLRVLLSPLLLSLGLAACRSKHVTTEPSTPASKAIVSTPPSPDRRLDESLKALGPSTTGASSKGRPRSWRTPSPPPMVYDRDDTFREDVAMIKIQLPTWDTGSAVAVRFLKETTGKRLSLVYTEPTPPEKVTWGSLIRGQTVDGNQVVGHYLILLKTVAAGHYEGGPSKNDVVMASLLEPTWKGDAPAAGWSTNPGSWCEIALRPGQKPGQFEGDFRAKLVTNDGDSFVTIENGYIYIDPGS